MEELKELLSWTYEKTVIDNADDCMKLLKVIVSLCAILREKNILTEEEIIKIIDIFGKGTLIIK